MFLKRIISWCYYNFYVRRQLKELGDNSVLKYPFTIVNGKFISIGKRATIFSNVLFQAIKESDQDEPSIIIGDNVRIWSNVQISAAQKMTIGNDVAIAANSFITDTTHPYEDISKAPRYNKLKFLTPVSIGDDTWVGRNVIISGSKIGKHCIIGANSMVSKNIPDYCVVVGNPARIVKRYNPITGIWEKTDKEGNFLVESK